MFERSSYSAAPYPTQVVVTVGNDANVEAKSFTLLFGAPGQYDVTLTVRPTVGPKTAEKEEDEGMEGSFALYVASKVNM